MEQPLLFIHSEEIYNFNAAREVCPLIFGIVKPKNILDVGCGIGTWLAVCKELGAKEVLGVDGEYVDPLSLKIPSDEYIPHDISKPISLNRKFDIVFCLEVAEHIPPQASKVLIENLVRHSDTILFSAAIPNQGGQNHINEQWPDYWQELFADFGYSPFDLLRSQIWDNEKIDWWYRQNILIYASKTSSIAQNYTPNQHIMKLVHPGLLKFKAEEMARLNKYMDMPPTEFLLRKLVKSFFYIFRGLPNRYKK